MKGKKMISLALALALALGMSGCGGGGSSSGSGGSSSSGGPDGPADSGAGSGERPAGVTVTDMKGREITLEGPAQRVVALTASDCEILYAIGAGDALVGRGKYCDYPAQVLDVPAVESGATTNMEEIIALDPDVLLMSDMAQTDEQIAQMEAAGIHVVVSETTDIQGVYTAVEMIGALMGREDNAAQVIQNMKDTFDQIREQSAGDGSQTIYFEVSPLQYGLWAAGSNTFMDEIAGMMGLTNCFADVDGWGEISEEQVIQRNPDIIVTVTMYFGEGPSPEEEILSRTGWEDVTAVKNSAILNLRDNELSRPAPRLAEGAQMLFDFVYGVESYTALKK